MKTSKIIKRNSNIDDFFSSIINLRTGFDFSEIKSTTTGGYWSGFDEIYNDRNNSPESQEFFSIVAELLRCIDLRHIGSGILYTSAYPSQGMIEYNELIEPIVRQYIDENLWDDICTSEWQDEELEELLKERGGFE